MSQSKRGALAPSLDEDEENWDRMQLEEEHDEEYNQLLRSAVTKKPKQDNSFFKTNNRYRTLPRHKIQKQHGSWQGLEDSQENQDNAQQEIDNDDQLKANEQQEQEDVSQLQDNADYLQDNGDQKEENDEQREESQEVEANKQFKQAFADVQRKGLEEVQNMQSTLQLLEQEDHHSRKAKVEHQDDALNFKSSLKLLSLLYGYRYSAERGLSQIKKYPIRYNCLPFNPQLGRSNSLLSKKMMVNLKKLLKAYDNLSSKVAPQNQPKGIQNKMEGFINQIEKAEEELNFDALSSKSWDMPALYAAFSTNSSQISRSIEDNLIKWSQKTTLISMSSSKYGSLSMQTPIGQAKKILQNWDRVAAKARLKRKSLRILLEQKDNQLQTTNPQIYDDWQFFTQVQKECVGEIANEDNEFMMGNTLSYLKRRENQGSKKIKEVDRKASKNRKIRFTVHPKLVNFVPSAGDLTCSIRDEVVANIFNCNGNSSSSKGRETNNKQRQIDYIDIA